MGKRLICLSHSVDVLSGGHRAAVSVISIYQFRSQVLVHSFALFAPGRLHNPTKSKRLLAPEIHLHWDLITGPADTFAADFK